MQGGSAIYTAPMTESGGQQQATTIETTLDALQSTFDDNPRSDSWRRNLALIAILVALFGVAAWQTLIGKDVAAELVQFDLVSQTSDEHAWLEPGFLQVFAAYAQAGNRIRLQLRDDSAVSAPSAALLSPSAAGPKSSATLQLTLTGPGANGALELSLMFSVLGKEYTSVLEGSVDGLADLASRATLQLYFWLDIDPYSSQDSQTARREIPLNSTAARHFALGSQALRRGEGRLAVDELNRAAELEPSHAMVNAALASALELAGYAGRATQRIRQAYAGSQDLSREKQLAIEAQLRLSERDWSRAESLYAALAAFYPQEISYGLSLATAAQNAGRTTVALEALDRLRKQPEFVGDPRIDLAEAKLWRRVGEWKKGVTAVEHAIEKAQLQGHRGTLARALVLRAQLEGDPEGGGLELAQELFSEIGDARGQALLLEEYGDRHVANGQLDRAIVAYNDAEVIAQRLGNEADLASIRQARAIATDLAGRLEEGYTLKKSLLIDAQRRQLHARAAIIKENLGVSAFKLGKLQESLDWFDSALQDFQTVDDQIGIAWYPYRKGRVLATKGDFAAATQLFDESLRNAREHPEGNLALHTRYELARLAVFQDSPTAATQLESLVMDYHAEQLYLDEAATRVVFAHHELIVGRRDAALAMLDEAQRVFSDSGSVYYLTRALALRVRAGDLGACDELADQVRTLEHREDALLGRAALQYCAEDNAALVSDLEAAQGAELFEAMLALTSLQDPALAESLGHSRGWVKSAYWLERE